MFVAFAEPQITKYPNTKYKNPNVIGIPKTLPITQEFNGNKIDEPIVIEKSGTYGGIVLLIKYTKITTNTASAHRRKDGDRPLDALRDWEETFL